MSKQKKSSGNFVYQDLKRKNGLKSTRGAERAKRQAKVKRNERWRKANGVITKGQAARRAKLAREMVQDRSLAEPTADPDAEEYPVFSRGFDREALMNIIRGETHPPPSHPVTKLKIFPNSSLTEILTSGFGHAAFRPGQEAAVNSVLRGERTLVVLPTGQGKSLCYQLPALILASKEYARSQEEPSEGCMTLVVSPLIALMSDQLKNLPICLRGAALHSEISPTNFQHVLTAVKHNMLDVIFVSPERLLMFNFQENFRGRIGLVCVDEAHCLSEWSHTFRPSYLRLRRVIDEIGSKRVLALTATASQNTLNELVGLLKLVTVVREDGVEMTATPVVGEVLNSRFKGLVLRSNLTVRAQTSADPLMDMLEMLHKAEWRKKRSIIVYVPYQWQTEQTARVMSQQGLGPAEPYHAGLLASDRAAVQRRFMNGDTRVVVATVAFSMGIDKSDVNGVVHLEMPRSVEQYVQETGRAGRDGKLADCVCLFSEEEYGRMRRIIFSSTVDKRGVLRLLTWIIARDAKWSAEGGTLDEVFSLGEEAIGHVTSIDIASCTRRLNCTSEQLEGMLTTIEKNSANGFHPFLNFPRVVKLRFFRKTLDELTEGGTHQFFQILLSSPVGKDGVVVPNSGVYTVDVLKAALALKINPPTFMKSLTEHAKDSFAIEKKDWAHFVYVSGSASASGGGLVAKLLGVISQTAENFMNEQLRKIDSIFALLNRVSLEAENLTLPHTLVQRYFQGATVEELVGDHDLIKHAIARASGHGATNEDDAAYPWIRSEVIDLVRELATDSPTSITKFLHALPSPNFATKDWKTHRSWGAWTQLPFDILLAHVSQAVNEVLSRN